MNQIVITKKDNLYDVLVMGEGRTDEAYRRLTADGLRDIIYLLLGKLK